MSRYFNSFMDNSSEDLEHSWGTSPKAKAREKEYNHWYYQKHKDEIAAIKKQKHEALNKYKQAEKNRKDAEKYWSLSTQMYDRYFDNPETLNESNFDSPYKSFNKYTDMYEESEKKYRDLTYQGNRLKALAEYGANSLIHDIKNPKVRDLVEFYLDTTVAKAKKSANKAANKAKRYATKAMSTAEKYATEAMSTAEKYATKAVSNAEKSARKAKKYATKTIKSIVR